MFDSGDAMILYLCPETSEWSNKPCDCPDRDKDDDMGGHAAFEVPDPEATVARLVNLIADAHDSLNCGDDAHAMGLLFEAYQDMTGNLL